MNVHDLSAGFALDALDEDERIAFEEHLPGCERCRDDVTRLTHALALLADEKVAPPPELRARVIEGASATHQGRRAWWRVRRAKPRSR